MSEYSEWSDGLLFSELGHIEAKQHKFMDDNKAGILDPAKAKEDVEYWNSLARQSTDIEYELEERGYYRNVDTGEWLKERDLDNE